MLNFHVIRWRNFLSTGSQFTEVFLDKSTTTLIIGENGAGKSTILDAICYALFNKPLDGISLQRLVNVNNSIKNTLMEVRIFFTKKNGEKRDLRCSLSPLYFPPSIIQEHMDHLDEMHKRPENKDVIAVWDLDNGGWKSFRVDSVEYVEFLDAY